MKKKILVLSPYFPYPAYDGGKVRIYNLIKHLSLNNDVYLLSYIEPNFDNKNIFEIKKFCKEVYVVIRKENEKLDVPNVPRCCSFFHTNDMVKELEKVFKDINPDIVQIEFLVMSHYINYINHKIPIVYTEHDTSHLFFEKSFHDRDIEEKIRFVEWCKLMEYIKSILPKFSFVIMLTYNDNKIFKKNFSKIKTVVIPTGVDINYFEYKFNTNKPEKNIMYLGHYRHYPNYDAVNYFVKNIFPKVYKKVPDIKFFVVGSGVIGNLEKLSCNNVIVTGEVSDVREYFYNSQVFVAPIRLGGGIKGKVLEAMSCGVAVVAIKEVVDGIKCEIGKEILVGENDNDFANKIIKLLTNSNIRKKISLNARKFVERKYSWKKIVKKLENFYDKLIV